MNKNWYCYFFELAPNLFIFGAEDYIQPNKRIVMLVDNVSIKLKKFQIEEELFEYEDKLYRTLKENGIV